MATKLQLILARNLKARRGRLGYSQAKLAELVGLSVPFIAEIEIGRKSPSLATLDRLATALEVEAFELIMDEKAVARSSGSALTDVMVEDMANTIREKLEEYLGQ